MLTVFWYPLERESGNFSHRESEAGVVSLAGAFDSKPSADNRGGSIVFQKAGTGVILFLGT